MDLLKRIEKMIPEEGTVTADVAQNQSQGNVDVVGGECPDGYFYCPKKKKCVKDSKSNESIVSGAVVGSGQTRVVGQKDKYLTVVRRNPRPLKFSQLTGAYLPPVEDEEPYEEEIEEGLFSGGSLKKYFEMAKKSWHGLDIELDKKKKEIHIMAGTERIMDAVFDWAKDKLPIKTKVIKSQGIVTIKV